MSTVLSIDSLQVSYGAIKAVNGISIEVASGSITAILGANGSGKSTLLKAISGLVKPSAGSMRFNGRDITGLKPEVIANLGICQAPEGRQIFGELSVEENLSIGAFTIRSAPQREINRDQVFTYFPVLKERRSQIAQTLSGGEQQMLAIGRALMASPKLLVLDEPSLGLAPLIVRDIFSIIDEIRKNGTTVLIVEQNALQTLKIADQAYVLQVGTVFKSGDAALLREDPELIEAYLGRGENTKNT